MGENTQIAWTDHTFSPWIGCSRVHAGCANCYAAAKAGRFGVQWGPNGTRRRTSDAYLQAPLAWDANALAAGHRSRVFPSLCDPFEAWTGEIVSSRGELGWVTPEGVTIWATPADSLAADLPGQACRALTMDDIRRDFFGVIDQTPNLDWLLLTKRPENIRRMWPLVSDGTDSGESDEQYMENSWLLYSASDQESLGVGVGHLLECRDLSPVLGLSLEPLIGPVDLGEYLPCDCVAADRSGWEPGPVARRKLCQACGGSPFAGALDWVIVGGESGPNARPCYLEWILDIARQCKAAGVPCFVKQMGGHAMAGDVTRFEFLRQFGPIAGGARIPFSHPKGGDPAEWPEDLRVQEYPTMTDSGQRRERGQ